MAMFGRLTGQGLPKPQMTSPQQQSGSDKLFLLGALLNDIGNGDGPQTVLGAQQFLSERSAKAAERDWQQGLLGRLGGPQGGGMVGGLPGGPQASGEGATAPAATASLRDLAPYLMLGASKGYKGVGDMVSILDKVQPEIDFVNGVAVDKRGAKAGDRVGVNLSNVNGFTVDMQDPKNAGRYFGEAPAKGARPTFDQDGKHIGWQMMDGSIQAIEATRAAEQRGQVGETYYRVPNADGSETFVKGKDYDAMGGGRERGVGTSQSPGNKIYSEKQAQAAADKFKAYDDAGSQAASKISRLEQMRGLLAGVDGGRLTPTGLEVASVANSLGIKLDPKLGNKEAATALSNQIALDMMGGSLGAGFSNADRDFVTSMVPRLGQSTAGRSQLLDMSVAAEKRKQQVATMARAWQQRFGRIDAADGKGKTFEDYLAQYADRNRLYGGR